MKPLTLKFAKPEGKVVRAVLLFENGNLVRPKFEAVPEIVAALEALPHVTLTLERTFFERYVRETGRRGLAAGVEFSISDQPGDAAITATTRTDELIEALGGTEDDLNYLKGANPPPAGGEPTTKEMAAALAGLFKSMAVLNRSEHFGVGRRLSFLKASMLECFTISVPMQMIYLFAEEFAEVGYSAQEINAPGERSWPGVHGPED